MRVKIRDQNSDVGNMQQGLKQGGVLSTSLLCLFMHDKIQMLQQAQVGAKVGDNSIPIIAYADGEVLISTSPKEMQQMLDIAYNHSTKWRYQYNIRKSKIMVFGKIEGCKAWKLGKEEMQVVNEYTHLGVIMATRT